MTKEKCFIILTFMLGMVTAQSSYRYCITPDNINGVCKKIHDCPRLVALLNQTDDPVKLDLLKKSLCGFENKKPIACCPLVNVTTGLPPNNTCGMRKISDVIKIVGGNPAKLGSWPWIAAIGYQSNNKKKRDGSIQWNCGGTLISNTHVLTAAHCVTNLGNQEVTTVRLGELIFNNDTDGATPLNVQIKSIIYHRNFDILHKTNDIALLTLQKSVSFTDQIQPICLPSSLMRTNKGKMMYVAGWGNTQANSIINSKNTVLMEVEVQVMSTEECSQAFQKGRNTIDSRVMCAGVDEGGKDSCRGDSGGPLMLSINKQIFLMGIVSYGSEECGKRGIPGVYTNVPSFLDWITEKISKN